MIGKSAIIDKILRLYISKALNAICGFLNQLVRVKFSLEHYTFSPHHYVLEMVYKYFLE